MQDAGYFGRINQQMETGGREALLHLLLSRDISQFNVREVVRTEALRDQQRQTLAPHEAAFIDVLRQGRTPDADYWKHGFGPEYISIDALVRASRVHDTRGNRTRLGVFMKRVCVMDSLKPVCVHPGRLHVSIKNPEDPTQRIEVPYNPERHEGLPQRAVRLKLYRLRPLSELREEWAHLEDSPWPEDGNKWQYHDDPA